MKKTHIRHIFKQEEEANYQNNTGTWKTLEKG